MLFGNYNIVLAIDDTNDCRQVMARLYDCFKPDGKNFVIPLYQLSQAKVTIEERGEAIETMSLMQFLERYWRNSMIHFKIQGDGLHVSCNSFW